MKVFEIIIEGYKEAVTDFSQIADPQQVNTAINTYKDLVNKNQVSGLERNIDHWRKQGWQAFAAFVNTKAQAPTKTQVKRQKIVGEAITLQETDTWLVVIPLDKNSSCFHGKNSDWCTTKPNRSYFEDYFYNREIILIYCLNKKTAGMWAIAAHTSTDKLELFNQQDDPITAEVFSTQTGLDPHALVAVAKNKSNQQTIYSTRKVYTDALRKLQQIEDSGELWIKSDNTEALLEITRAPNFCYKYIDGQYWYDRKPVDVPQSIITAAMTNAPEIASEVNFSKHPELFVYRMIKEFGVLYGVIDSGYKFSETLLKKIFDSAENESTKNQYVSQLINRGIPVADEYVLASTGNPQSAKRKLHNYEIGKLIPSHAVQLHIVTLAPELLGNLLELNANPTEDVVLTALKSSDNTVGLIHNLIWNNHPISRKIIIAASRNSSKKLLDCLTVLMANHIMPPIDLLLEVDKYYPGDVVKVMNQFGMEIPKELTKSYQKPNASAQLEPTV